MAYVVMNTVEFHEVQGLTTRLTEAQKEPLVAETVDQFSGSQNCVWNTYSYLAIYPCHCPGRLYYFIVNGLRS